MYGMGSACVVCVCGIYGVFVLCIVCMWYICSAYVGWCMHYVCVIYVFIQYLDRYFVYLVKVI